MISRSLRTRLAARPSGVAPLLLALAAGCGSPPPAALPAPALEVSVAYSRGSPLSSDPRSGSAEPHDASSAWPVRTTLFALEALPEAALEPLAPRVRLVALERGDDPLAPVNRVIDGRLAVVDTVEEVVEALVAGVYGRSAEIARLEAALPPGVTAVFRLDGAEGSVDAGRRGELRLYRRPPAVEEGGDPVVEVAFVLDGVVAASPVEPAPGDEPSSREPLPPPEPQREWILLEPFALDEARIAFFLRSPFTSSPAASLAFTVDVVAPAARAAWNDAERQRFAAVVARCEEELAAAAAADPDAAGKDAAWPGLATAIAELRRTFRRRPAFLFLAQESGAKLAEEVALSSSDEFVDALAVEVERQIGEAGPRSEAELAWLLERATVRRLASALTDKRATVADEALLALHTGEVGMHAPVLDELAAAATTLHEFHRRLIHENLNYLEDISPAARSRAVRWLEARGLVPEGYDPLADVEERRAALAAAAAPRGEDQPASQEEGR